MRRNGLHPALTVLLVLVGLVVLGPPALVLLAGLIGLSIGLVAIGVKLAFVAFVIFAIVSLFRAVFGRSQPRAQASVMPRSSPVDEAYEESLARDLAQKRALDEELARVMASTGQSL